MDKYNRKRTILTVSILLGIVVSVVALFIYLLTRNPYGDELSVSNLSSYTSGKPSRKNSVDAIQRNLFLTVGKNVTDSTKVNSIKDVYIRKGTFVQNFNSASQVHTVSFIVDIKSLRQSYNISYQWSDNGSRKYIDEYGTRVSCLAIDKLIYGDFDCVDSQILEKGKLYYNPVEKILPYTAQYKYSIKNYTTILESDKVNLKVEAFVPSWADKNATLDGYSKEIKGWLRSKKLNPDNYYLEYLY